MDDSVLPEDHINSNHPCTGSLQQCSKQIVSLPLHEEQFSGAAADHPSPLRSPKILPPSINIILLFFNLLSLQLFFQLRNSSHITSLLQRARRKQCLLPLEPSDWGEQTEEDTAMTVIPFRALKLFK